MREIESTMHPHAHSEVYAAVSDLLAPEVTWKTILHWIANVALSFAAAIALFLLVSLLKSFATPSQDDVISCNQASPVELIPPTVLQPVKPPDPVDEPEREEDPLLRPEFHEIDLRPFVDGGGQVRIPSWNYEPTEIGNLDAIFNIGEVDEIPRPTRQIAPHYPAGLKRLGVGGRVVIEFIVDLRGNVVNPVVVEATHPAFRKACLEAIRKWKFEPGINNGVPVKVRMRQPLGFSVNK